MERSRKNRRGLRWTGAILVGASMFQTSCGTILYPERRGQKSGQLDVAVILLDGACLLVFVIPGIIAFAVDFATGAIYLPPEKSYEKSPDKRFDQVHVSPADLTPQRLEAIVRQRTGKTIQLSDGTCRAMPLASIEQLTPQAVAALEAAPAGGFDELVKAAAERSVAPPAAGRYDVTP
jgi:hypothetical protein